MQRLLDGLNVIYAIAFRSVLWIAFENLADFRMRAKCWHTGLAVYNNRRSRFLRIAIPRGEIPVNLRSSAYVWWLVLNLIVGHSGVDYDRYRLGNTLLA